MVSSIESQSKISLDEFLQLPETKPAREYINSYIYQKSMPQGEHSILQTRLVTAINRVGEPQKLAYVLTELRCIFGGSSIVPDIAIFEWDNIPLRPNKRIQNRFEIPPDWIIEILSPEQSPNRVIKKIIFSLKQGTKLGWFIDPEDESVSIFQPNCIPEVKSGMDSLPVLNVLNNWQFSVTDLFSLLYLV
ncbi:Uma2 family endonuclease [Planktothrix agardhii 1032]|uniref:Uma2 family endonuclease n=1 Tax=Planktothrix agardhii TaxID=1160 RepID=UPI001F2DC21D|nr:Uma2 family endonuclease [Planktothrix agardhii]MCF3598521.1 Uma2 family endonuclease [Planktothrix agardhii 1032]